MEKHEPAVTILNIPLARYWLIQCRIEHIKKGGRVNLAPSWAVERIRYAEKKGYLRIDAPDMEETITNDLHLFCEDSHCQFERVVMYPLIRKK